MLADHSDAPLMRRCRQEVLVLAAPMIERCLNAAQGSLDEAVRGSSSAAERRAVQDARDKLEQRRAAIRSSFPAALDQAIAQALDAAGQQSADQRGRGPGVPPSETALVLPGDSELSRLVETARLVQSTQPVVERTLARFDALMRSALERTSVPPGLNPMRPEVLWRTLRQVLDGQGESAEVCGLWLHHLTQSYAKELAGLYGAVGDALEQAQAQQAHDRVKRAEGAAGLAVAMGDSTPLSAQTGASPLNGASGAPGSISGAGRVNLGELAGGQISEEELPDEEVIRRRRAPRTEVGELVSAYMVEPQLAMCRLLDNPQLAQQYEAPLPPDYYTELQRQLAQMPAAAGRREPARSDAVAAIDHQAWAVMPQMLLPSQQWEPGEQAVSSPARARAVMELKAKAVKIGQALGIDAVHALVAQVVGEQRILAPVRDALAALEPALLRLTLAEPHFFGESAHPARRFIEEIVQHSFQYDSESASGYPAFADAVQQAVQTLDAVAEPSGEDFDQSLQALQADWQTQDEAERQARAQSQRSLDFAQKRQQLADKIARDLNRRSDLAGVPRALAEFLLKDWSLVIAHAQLTDERRELDPGGYLAIVTDLLWSVKRDEILRHFTRLFETVLRVIATLRRGLDMLGKDSQDVQALFDLLLRFHEPVLKLRRLRSTLNQGATLEELAATLQLPEEKNLIKPGEWPNLQTAAQPWLGRRERDVVGFMDGDGSHNPDTLAPADSVSAQSMDAKTAAHARAQLAGLRRDDWVDLRLGQEWQRAQLTWISDNGSLYTFISHGGRAHSMTRHTLEKLLGSDHIRPLDSDAVVDKALRTVIANAERELAVAGYTTRTKI